MKFCPNEVIKLKNLAVYYSDFKINLIWLLKNKNKF